MYNLVLGAKLSLSYTIINAIVMNNHYIFGLRFGLENEIYNYLRLKIRGVWGENF